MPVHRSVSMLFTAVLCCSTLTSFVVAVMDVSFRPPEGAFLLRKSGQKTEDMERHWLGTAFLPGGCAARPDQTLLVEHANFKQEVPLLPLAALHHNRSCGVSVRPVADSVDVQRPYVDALVYADKDFLAFYDHPVCVTVLATWSGRSTVASCSLFSRTQRFACLARLVLPVDWFDLSDQQQSSGKRPRRYVQLSYTTEHFNSCPASVERTIAQLDGITTPVPSPILLRNEGAYETLEIDRQESWSVSLMVPTNMTLSAKSYTSFFLHFAYQASTEHNNPPLFLFQLRVRFHRFRLISFATTDVANWSVKGEPAIDDNDTISFICLYNNGMSLNETWSGPIFAMLLETKGDGDSTTLDAEASIHWDVRYVVDRRAAARSALLPRNDSQTVEENSAANSTTTTVTPPKIAAFNKYTSTISSAIQNHDSGKITMQFTISKDTTYAIVVAAKSNELINTAVLSGLQSSILLRIYSITLGGDVSDVTFKSSCKSLEPRVLKSSPSCSTVFVDGSELRGMAEAIVEATFETFSTTTTFIVWYPKMPVTVWLSDPVLNAVKDWRLPVLKQLDIKDNSVPAVNSAPRRKRAEAKQLTCRVLYQQAEVKVFAQFHVSNDKTGERLLLGGLSRDILMDVTEISQKNIDSLDHSVASIRRVSDGHRVIVEGVSVGQTQIVLRSHLPRLEYGSTRIAVSKETVTARALLADAVPGLSVALSSGDNDDQLAIQVRVKQIFTSKYHQGTLTTAVVYSDEQTTDIADMSRSDYLLSAWSRGDRYIAVQPMSDELNRPTASYRLIALDDANKGASVNVELRSPAHCQDPEGAPMLTAYTFVEAAFNQFPQVLEEEKNNPKASDISSFHPRQMSIESIQVSDATAEAEPDKNRKSSLSDKNAVQHRHSSSSFEGSLVVVVAVVAMAASVAIINCFVSRGRHLQSGYKFQRLVPLLSKWRGSRDADTSCQDWVWLSKGQLEGTSIGNGSIDSRYSRTSTIGAGDSLEMRTETEHVTLGSASYGSADTAARRSVSYRGSEVSIFISPQPLMRVNEPHRTTERRTASWTSKPRSRVRITANPLADSSSEQNLSTLAASSPLGIDGPALARSAGQVDWDSASLGLNEAEMHHYIDGLRETIA